MSGESSTNLWQLALWFLPKFVVEKFDETNNFGMWQCKVMDVLVEQELNIALEDKLVELSNIDWEKINR